MVLVTGGSGLIGKELIKLLLLQNKTVIATYNKTPLPDFNTPLLTQIHCTILDAAQLEEIMQEVEEVYHCAALVTFNAARVKELYSINVEGTANVVNAALNTGVKKLVYISSVAALGKKINNSTIDEKIKSADQDKNNPYGKSKYLAEMEVWRGIAEGLNAVIVNPTVVLGAGDWSKGSTKIFQTVYNEFPWYSDGVTGFVDARDVARAMIQLMNSSITNERFIVSATNKSYEEVFTLIAKSFNKKPPYKKVTPFLSSLVWRLEAFKSYFTGAEPLVTKDTAATALKKVHYDNSKLLKALPTFQYTPLEQTIIDTCTIFATKN
ncbi:NAD-dependent epimerase/dehydratase family protein [Ferruginibacter albus]|uniref:NAD-dependent epimerase/dehydratase family protein n=1 Tax=Ferruginibacter albus TaxID=2875540 RepID=UPI001CC5F7E0|nr:NAD-dependent epimerase/dehydratase family protein [Ferruginibacter albus]UAY51895.1 NAD-dependent epimerase/dehydratase family protein [Ferruginibacter albus]